MRTVVALVAGLADFINLAATPDQGYLPIRDILARRHKKTRWTDETVRNKKTYDKISLPTEMKANYRDKQSDWKAVRPFFIANSLDPKRTISNVTDMSMTMVPDPSCVPFDM